MSNVIFDEESVSVRGQARSEKPKGGLYALVIRMGLAKNDKEATIVLLVIAVFAIIIGVAYPFLFA